MNERDAVIQVNHMQTSFKMGKTRLIAVNDISFKAYEGRMLGLVGESGCGKSVTAHSITRLLPKNGRIDEGEILFYRKNGMVVDIRKQKPDHKVMRELLGSDIGMVFQDPQSSLNPVYSVGSQIVEKLRAHKRLANKEAKEYVIELLTRLSIPEASERFHDYPHQFSGGMKQRVMIAIALVNNPRLLIADEPTTALDVTIQAQILELLEDIKSNYRSAIVLITHNMGIVAECADDIAVMYMGRIVEIASKRNVFSNPSHPYTQALLRSVPVLGMGSTVRLEPIRGVTPDPRQLPKGCAFSPRCEFTMDVCTHVMPELLEVSQDHLVACHLCKGIKPDDESV